MGSYSAGYVALMARLDEQQFAALQAAGPERAREMVLDWIEGRTGEHFVTLTELRDALCVLLFPADAHAALTTVEALLADRAQLLKELDNLQKLVRDAFHEGFTEGMREHTSSRGGNTWNESRVARLLATAPEKHRG